MPTPDFFTGRSFNTLEMTAAINGLPVRPGRLGQLGLFEETGIASKMVAIERNNRTLNLVPVSPRGSPGDTRGPDARSAVPLIVPHLQRNDRLMADSVQDVRVFGGTGTETVNARRDELLAIHRSDIEATIEWHRVGALKGLITDGDGTVILNLFTEFGATQTVVDMALDVATTDIRARLADVEDAIENALGAVPYDGMRVFAGRTFWSTLINHDNVVRTYLNTQEASALRGAPGEQFVFGGAIFERYKGKLGATPYIADNEAYAVPVGVRGLMRTFFAPADWVDTVNTVGLPMYAKGINDQMGHGVDIEVQANPLSIVTLPDAIIKLTI